MSGVGTIVGFGFSPPTIGLLDVGSGVGETVGEEVGEITGVAGGIEIFVFESGLVVCVEFDPFNQNIPPPMPPTVSNPNAKIDSSQKVLKPDFEAGFGSANAAGAVSDLGSSPILFSA